MSKVGRYNKKMTYRIGNKSKVALMNVVSRDWAIEISTPDELTVLNSWLRAIDQGCMILGCGLAGIAIAYDKMIGCVVIGGINIIAMVIQAVMLWKTYHLIPELGQPRNVNAEKQAKSSIKDKLKYFYESWYLFVKDRVGYTNQIYGSVGPAHRNVMKIFSNSTSSQMLFYLAWY